VVDLERSKKEAESTISKKERDLAQAQAKMDEEQNQVNFPFI